jgi:CheY-like chemotaxis protein
MVVFYYSASKFGHSHKAGVISRGVRRWEVLNCFRDPGIACGGKKPLADPNMRTPTILIAEDDSTDVFLLQWAFKTAGVSATPDFVRDGLEVIEYLQGQSKLKRKHLPEARPDLLILDLKMPRMTGFEVLEWLRHCPELRPANVVVFSSSFTPEDLERAGVYRIDHYFVKPTDVTELVAMVKRLEPYWGAKKVEVAGAPATPQLEPAVYLAA